MYNNQYRPISPYAQRLTALEQQMMYQQPTVPVPQTIQPVNTAIQTQIYCYSVNSADELSSLNLMPNTTFLGINNTAKEIYVRKLNNDGLIENEIYKKYSGSQEKDGYNVIMEKLTAIEEKLSMKENEDGKRIFKPDYRPNETRTSAKKSDDGSF